MRVLILSADIGEGHDLPARMVADQIRLRVPGAEIAVVDTVAAGGPVAQLVLRAGAERILRQFPAVYDAQYALAMNSPLRVVGTAGMPAAIGRRLRRTVAEHRPDVVVCTYPMASHVLGVLRALGRLAVPVVSAVTDLAALRYWAHRGCDLHLLTHEESAIEVRAVAGADARTATVRGLTDPAFERPADPGAARAALGLPANDPVVVVSGGGWGVGDLEGAVRTVLTAAPAATVVGLCGRHDEAVAALEARFAGDRRVRPMGFTDRMPELLDAADVLVHSTAGLTALEAMIRRARVVSYGWSVGHIRANDAAYERFGLARVARDRGALGGAVRAALADGPGPALGYAERPAAADLVLGLARPATGPSLEACGPARGEGQGRGPTARPVLPRGPRRPPPARSR